MNIWIVSDGEPLPTDSGNVRLRRMGMVSKILADMGHEVNWFSSSFHHYKKIQRVDKDQSIVVDNNLTIHLIRTKGYKKNVSMDRLKHHKTLAKKFILNTKNMMEPDLILATMAPLELSQAVIEYSELKRIPTVIDIRDLWPEIYKEVIPKWGQTVITPYINYNRKKLSNVLKKSTSIIGVTPKFLDYGLNVANMTKRDSDKVFYTSYKPRDLTVANNQFLKNWSKFEIDKNDFIITFLGNFGKQFVIEPIIEAAEQLREHEDIKFVLCGVGESYNTIKKKSRNLRNVVLPGWIEEEQILSLLSVSSLGIAPYRDSINFTYNTPNKFSEYLSASLPILLGVDGIMAELASEYNCGVTYKDSNELTNKIIDLYYDKNNIIEMSKNAYRLYNDNFNSEKVYVEFAKHLLKIGNKKDKDELR